MRKTSGDLSYSIPEEMKRGYVIGNIAKDLGLKTDGLLFRKARLDTDENGNRFCEINPQNGEFIVADRIDREELCGSKSSCILKYDIVLENPLELHRISVKIEDINDNSPRFPNELIKLEIAESLGTGTRFPLEEAHDADEGRNGIQNYSLEENEHFSLAVHSNSDGGKYCELVLQKELDREQKKDMDLILAAIDGGTPIRSGTVV